MVVDSDRTIEVPCELEYRSDEPYAVRATFPPGLGYDEPLRFLEPERLEQAVEALFSRGYETGDIEGLLGGNLMRLAKSVWKAPRPAPEAAVDQGTSTLP